MRAQAGAQAGPFDFTTERAMGKIDEVTPLCAAALKAGGYFTPLLALRDGPAQITLDKSLLRARPPHIYTLPAQDKQRKIAVYERVYKN
jgi:16S rRNA G527 N7-methylase RsmG